MGCDVSFPWPEWEAVEHLGSGTFGMVYEAERREHGFVSHAAIKIIPIPRDKGTIHALISEGLSGASIQASIEKHVESAVNEIKLMEYMKGHSNVVSIEDFKIEKNDDGYGYTLYVRMELLTPFAQHAGVNPMSEADVIKLGQDICTALEQCAKQNIIHRDIKPQNVFMAPSGDFKLGDFSNSRQLEGTNHTQSISGTPNYNAPEIFAAQKYDARVDVYSLGLLLYKILNDNCLPFMKKGSLAFGAALQRRINGEALPPPSKASEAMAKVILKACAYDPADRYQNAFEFRQALDALVLSKTNNSNLPSNGETAQEPATPAKKQVNKRIIAVLAAALGVIALAVSIVVFSNNRAVAKHHFAKGNSYSLSEQYEKAVAEYSEALRRARNYPGALLNRALAYNELARYDEAVSDYKASGSSEHSNIFARAYYENGLEKLGSKDYGNSISSFSDAISLRRDYAEAYFQRGIATFFNSNVETFLYNDNALDDYEKAIELEPALASLKDANCAEMFFQLGKETRKNNANDLFCKAIAHDPDRKDLYLERAETYYFMLDDFESALKDVDSALELDNEYADAWSRRISFLEYEEKYSEAIDDCTKWLVFEPENASVYRRRAYSHEMLKQFDEAAKDYYRAIELDPEESYNLFSLIMSYEENGNYSEALKIYTKRIELDPENADRYCERAMCYVNLERYNDAIKDYSKAIEIEPTAYLYAERAKAFSYQGQHNKAVEDFAKAIALEPNAVEYYIELGEYYHNNGKHREAIQQYNKAISVDNTLIDAYIYRGNSFVDLGDHQSAVNSYSKAIEIAPEDPWPMINRGFYFENAEQYAKAIDDYNAVLKIDPDDDYGWHYSVYQNRGDCYYSLRKYSDALADFSKAIELDPESSYCYSRRADTYVRLGRLSFAAADRKKADELA